MHAVDLLARSQENDDKELKAWHNFFAACIRSKDDPIDSFRSLAATYHTSKVDEFVDAELLFYACILMATIVCETSGDETLIYWPFNKMRNISNGANSEGLAPFVVLPHHGLAGQVYDRISHLLRASPDPSSLTLISLARRLLNVFSCEDAATRLQQCQSFVSDRLSLGKRFSTLSAKLKSQSSFDSRFGQIDDLLNSSSGSPPSFLVSTITRLLSQAIRRQDTKTVWKSLLRLSRIRMQEGLIAQALLILDDIEEHVFGDCDVLDWGLLFQTRTESLLKLVSSQQLTDATPLIVDAFHNLQFAIACFDRAGSIPSLTRCVLMACLLSNKLKINPFTNFYSVKAAQIRSSMDCSTRFFPIEGQELDDIHNVMEFTGQPKLPFANLHNPPQAVPVPTSPVGRGMQTLIAWRQ